MEKAIFLSKFASKVTVVHRRADFRASKIMLERARAQENIELLTPYIVDEFVKGSSGALGAIGHEPQSGLVAGQVELDENGYVKTDGKSTRTNRPGVFAAGDLVDHTYRQAITAAGSGCEAALDAEWYLRDTPEVPTPEVLPEGDLAEAQWATPAVQPADAL